MSAKTHPRLVGAFVLGAIALVLAAIVFLSSGGLFQQRDRFVVFFPGSVKGLQTGSEVTFRGVRVGEVIEVSAVPDRPARRPHPDRGGVRVLRGRRRRSRGGGQPLRGPRRTRRAVAMHIEQGIRARMMSASLLTGQKYIEIDFLPDEPARLAGLSRRYPEIPTTPYRHGEGGGADRGPHEQARRGAARPGRRERADRRSGPPVSCSSRRSSRGPSRERSAWSDRSSRPSPRRARR